MDALSPRRELKIERVKSRVSRKRYDTKELQGEMANKLAQSEDFRSRVSQLSFSKTDKGIHHSNSTPAGKKIRKPSLSVRKEKIKAAKERQKRGYYNNPEVFSKVAQRLLDLFHI
jgi:hypothetical protein